MSVSLITGIGEKVSPSRLTTPRVYVCGCVIHIPICLAKSCVCVCACACLSVAAKRDVDHAQGRN